MRGGPETLLWAARIGLAGVGLVPWLVPWVRAYLPAGELGLSLDAMFAPMCHRIPERAIEVAGVLMPVCSRCAGVYAGISLGALLAWPDLSASRWRAVMLVTGGLVLLEVALQDLGLHPIWHATRLGSGMLFAYAVTAACVGALRREALGASRPAT